MATMVLSLVAAYYLGKAAHSLDMQERIENGAAAFFFALSAFLLGVFAVFR